jgi:signal transduction histidine kinase
MLKKEINTNYVIESKLKELNDSLEDRIVKESIRRVEQEKVLEQQTKMAAMGEMMDAVAHQWKQPLNAITMYEELLRSDFEEGIVDQEYIDNFLEGTMLQVHHMVKTLDEFRGFFRQEQNIKIFNIRKMIDSVLLLVQDEFMQNQITIEVFTDNSHLIKAQENDIKHLILNMINNSKDAFNEKGIKNRTITISSTVKDKYLNIYFKDNAGGIPKNIINEIFKPNVTTKASGKGTGIGLYLSMQIANKYQGTISAKNDSDGVIFTFKIPIYQKKSLIN